MKVGVFDEERGMKRPPPRKPHPNPEKQIRKGSESIIAISSSSSFMFP